MSMVSLKDCTRSWMSSWQTFCDTSLPPIALMVVRLVRGSLPAPAPPPVAPPLELGQAWEM